jgi:hypothetical protein
LFASLAIEIYHLDLVGVWTFDIQDLATSCRKFSVHINDLPLRVNSASEPILFAVGTSIIISSSYFKDFCSLFNFMLCHMSKWFAANNLVLNLDKMNIIKFIIKNPSHSTLRISYKEICRRDNV